MERKKISSGVLILSIAIISLISISNLFEIARSANILNNTLSPTRTADTTSSSITSTAPDNSLTGTANTFSTDSSSGDTATVANTTSSTPTSGTETAQTADTASTTETATTTINTAPTAPENTTLSAPTTTTNTTTNNTVADTARTVTPTTSISASAEGTAATTSTTPIQQPQAVTTGTSTNTSTASTTAQVPTTSTSDPTLHMKLVNAIQSPVTKDQEIRIDFNQPVNNVTAKIEGRENRDLQTFKKQGVPNACFINLIVSDLPDGQYNLIVTVEQSTEKSTDSVPFEIKKSILDRIVQSALSIAKSECAKLGISDLEACKDKLIEEYSKNVQCENMSEEECKALLRQTYSDTLIALKSKYQKIKEKIEQHPGGEYTTKDLKDILNEGLDVQDITLPIQSASTKIKAIKTVESISVSKDQGIVQAAPVAITIDTDSDGIPDDTEKRIGTDPQKIDTDGDGYTDSQEILAGYDPLGPGKKDIQLSSIERAIIENKTIEQPKGSGSEKDTMSIAKVLNASEAPGAAAGAQGYVISGKAEPNSVATIFIYSDIPVVTTVSTDEFGNWEYHFDEPLADGNHEVYVAINDNTGKVVSKSKPFALPISQAKAVSPSDLTSVTDNGSKSFNNMIYYYMFAVLALIVFGILFFFYTILRQKNKMNNQQQ